MSLVIVRNAVQARLQTVAGVNRVLKYIPTSVQDPPLVYLWLDDSDDVSKGQIFGDRWRIMARLVIAWQDNEQAEEETAPLVDAILSALRADRHLGVAGAGAPLLESVDCEAGWVTIAGAEYRVIDFELSILDKQ